MSASGSDSLGGPGSRGASVVFCGPRAAGKTTLAVALAAELGWPAFDSDDLIAASVGCAVGAFLQREGEPRFREVEEAVVLSALLATGPRVLALGGGAVLSKKIRRVIAQDDHFVVLVLAPATVLAERLDTGPFRPSLTDLPREQEVAQLLSERESLYKSVSDLTLDTFSQNVSACLSRILATMDRGGG